MHRGTRVYAEAVVNPGPATVIAPLTNKEFAKWFGPVIKNSKQRNQVWVKVDRVQEGHCPFVLIEKRFLKPMNPHVVFRPRQVASVADTQKFRLGRRFKKRRRR
jgi:hypothetical protein